MNRLKLLCDECVEVDEDPRPWCDCIVDVNGIVETCKGPCRQRAHGIDRHNRLNRLFPVKAFYDMEKK
jgi:hypothetical protein